MHERLRYFRKEKGENRKHSVFRRVGLFASFVMKRSDVNWLCLLENQSEQLHNNGTEAKDAFEKLQN